MDVSIKEGQPNIYIIKEDCDAKIKEILMKIIYDDNTGGENDLNYELCYRAISIIEDQELEEIDDLENINIDEASAHINERLEYLNLNNQNDITDIVKEYDCDIQEACAIWYNNMVQDIMMLLIKYINE